MLWAQDGAVTTLVRPVGGLSSCTHAGHSLDRNPAMSLASWLSFAGVVTVAASPAAVLLATTVLHRPELVILAIGSACVWLLAITLCAVFWATAAVGTVARLVLVVGCGVAVQEGARWLTYVLYLRLLNGLRSVGLQQQGGITSALHTSAPAAVANGVGIGLVQMLVMYGDVAARALLPGGLYTEACHGLSLFAVDALCALGMLLLNVLLSLLGWTAAYPRRSRKLAGALVGLHLLASAATLLNSPQISPANGCAVALPCLFASLAAAALLTVYTISTSLADFAIARPGQHPAPHEHMRSG